MTDIASWLADLQAQLPQGFEIDRPTIRCQVCNRPWRWPKDGQLTAERIDYLVDHFLGHSRKTRKHAALRWRVNTDIEWP
jgi:hypothetical protein